MAEASTVYCTTADCPEYGLPKDNSAGYPVADIVCGGCSQPVSADQPSERTDQR